VVLVDSTISRWQAQDYAAYGLPPLKEFILTLVYSSDTQFSTLIGALVYLRRLKARLGPAAKGQQCVNYRIFLASLILASKYLNDITLLNKHWAKCSIVRTRSFSFGFSLAEINQMEREMLSILDWDLGITDDDIYWELRYFSEHNFLFSDLKVV